MSINIPILPLRDVVIYPHMIFPLFIGRKKSIKCLLIAMKKDKKIVLVAQKEKSTDKPCVKDLFKIGTISLVIQMVKLSDGTLKILVEGINRVKILEINDLKGYFFGKVNILLDSSISLQKKDALTKTLVNQFNRYAYLNDKISQEFISSLNIIEDLSKLSDTIAANIPMKLSKRQSVLEILDICKRIKYLMLVIEYEINLLKIEKKIRNRVKNQIEKNQREYYLNEQLKAIQEELGKKYLIQDDNKFLESKINSIKMPQDVLKKIKLEFKKLKIMSPLSAESTVIRTYIDWILSIPWYKKSKIKKNLIQAQNILDKDHYGLYEIKERILEYLAVQIRTNKIKGSILCLVGPPGVGKTSLGKSIAKATGRKFIKMALGGIRDEAEIRGHRRTYVGSMPGKLIQKISKVGVKNPVFLLDEIDKMSSDIRGDPAFSLLEVLDPEQNDSFNDHYLEVDYDLSDVMFIATANSINIIPPLLDRMEVIKLSGYTEDEKFNIAVNFLLKKQFKDNMLHKNELIIKDEVIISIIRFYTKESGVRNLEKNIAKICRKSVKILLTNVNIKNIIVNNYNLKKFLGAKKINYNKNIYHKKIGQVVGLAWTEFGGDIIIIESSCIFGKGKLIYTGSLGKVMQESIQTALTLVKSMINILKINSTFFENHDIHVHVPEGSIPKDGPSAGIAIYIVLISCIKNIFIKRSIAMTGEITLCGNILPIGGLKEKLLAAYRYGIKKIFIPYANKKDLKKISTVILNSFKIYLVKEVHEVLKKSFKNF